MNPSISILVDPARLISPTALLILAAGLTFGIGSDSHGAEHKWPVRDGNALSDLPSIPPPTDVGPSEVELMTAPHWKWPDPSDDRLVVRRNSHRHRPTPQREQDRREFPDTISEAVRMAKAVLSKAPVPRLVLTELVRSKQLGTNDIPTTRRSNDSHEDLAGRKRELHHLAQILERRYLRDHEAARKIYDEIRRCENNANRAQADDRRLQAKITSLEQQIQEDRHRKLLNDREFRLLAERHATGKHEEQLQIRSWLDFFEEMGIRHTQTYNDLVAHDRYLDATGELLPDFHPARIPLSNLGFKVYMLWWHDYIRDFNSLARTTQESRTRSEHMESRLVETQSQIARLRQRSVAARRHIDSRELQRLKPVYENMRQNLAFLKRLYKETHSALIDLDTRLTLNAYIESKQDSLSGITFDEGRGTNGNSELRSIPNLMQSPLQEGTIQRRAASSGGRSADSLGGTVPTHNSSNLLPSIFTDAPNISTGSSTIDTPPTINNRR